MIGKGFSKWAACAAATIALLTLAASASASSVVGDPGSRSLLFDTTTLNLLPLGIGSADSVGPMDEAVAPDGTFTVPADGLAWQMSGELPAGYVTSGPPCDSIQMSWNNISRTALAAATGPGSGQLDPAANTASLTFDALVTPATVVVPIAYSGKFACVSTAGSTTLTCTFTSSSMPVSLTSASGTDVRAGHLDLAGTPTTTIASPACSGGEVLGSALTALISGLQQALSATPNPGSLAITATLAPGAHEPSMPGFASPPTLSGDPTVGSTLTCAPAALSGLPVPDLATSWTRDGAPIAGAAAPTYLVQSDDAGHTITCVTHAANPVGMDERTSNAVQIQVPATTTLLTTSGDQGTVPATQPPGSTTTASKPAARCVVPKLKGMRLATAKKKLRASHCGLGKVKRSKARKRQRGKVLKSTPKAGAKKTSGFRVQLVVGR